MHVNKIKELETSIEDYDEELKEVLLEISNSYRSKLQFFRNELNYRKINNIKIEDNDK